ncbi:MAG: GntR family transcriptional regulator [Bacteroidales bacterium]
MDFNSNKPIYLQIADTICERILDDQLKPDDRIPSVREYGAQLGVNPNTMMRTYEKLTSDGIIYNKRGIGYFISQGAREIVLENEKKFFLENTLPGILKTIKLLGIDPSVFKENYK